MNKLIQCKDISTRSVLEFLAVHGGIGCNPYPDNTRSVLNAMPSGTPEKMGRSKMKILIRNGLVKGCACGCRGDFNITDRGREFIDGNANAGV